MCNMKDLYKERNADVQHYGKFCFKQSNCYSSHFYQKLRSPRSPILLPLPLGFSSLNLSHSRSSLALASTKSALSSRPSFTNCSYRLGAKACCASASFCRFSLSTASWYSFSPSSSSDIVGWFHPGRNTCD
mmetsp:Transcript_28548/g.37350  ORF Transcript_28548/g.37350 Transcript_28548/m.37350 type:complete len:131 (+) Transcript_28548:512-904(+)